MQQVQVTKTYRLGLVTSLVSLLCAFSLFLSQRLPILWSNLGYVRLNQAFQEISFSSPVSSQKLLQATRFLARSGRFEECNPLGFPTSSVVVCTQLNEWTQEIITLANQEQYLAFFAPSGIGGIRYRQVYSLVLSDQFTNLDSLTLFISTGNSTRIGQGELVAYAVVITDQEVYLMPLRAGVETADWAYAFPDVPPQHRKPVNSYHLSNGGESYPATIRFAKPVDPKLVTLVFSYGQYQHFEPGLAVWAVGIQLHGNS